ncbi:MAG: serine protease [Acidobacteriia bacterium]|nr:serine protease [Terriglobia bacterium]
MHRILSRRNAIIHPLFTGRRARRLVAGSAPPAAASDLSVFYRVSAPEEHLANLADQLRNDDSVEAAFVKPAPLPADAVNPMLPAADRAPAVTPDFTARQGYLDAAPNGIDARFAWNYPGGSGKDIRIIDVEGAWQLTHEDLIEGNNGLAGGNPLNDVNWRNHGTAVLGVFVSDHNGFGVTGICPGTHARAIAAFGDQINSAAAIHLAADLLSPGDIILVELHRPGPHFGFAGREDQRGFIAVEWWPDDLAAIEYATGRGITVVEAAGNGAEDLDDPLYDANPGPPFGPFPDSWTNPFRRHLVDSGAVLVGAGAPPPGTHGRNHGDNCSRLDFSNYGSAVDAQGWGREVTTCGYGDLQGGDSEDLWYTDTFAGTSSASPMIVGSLGCIQGALRAANRAQLAPLRAREILRQFGTPQQARPGQSALERIGNRPDLRQILLTLIGPPL